jgi:hypothetical protein
MAYNVVYRLTKKEKKKIRFAIFSQALVPAR